MWVVSRRELRDNKPASSNCGPKYSGCMSRYLLRRFLIRMRSGTSGSSVDTVLRIGFDVGVNVEVEVVGVEVIVGVSLFSLSVSRIGMSVASENRGIISYYIISLRLSRVRLVV